MQSKLLVSFILFLLPSLTAPVMVFFFLGIIPGPVGTFFKDYGAFFLWGCYLLLLTGWTIFYVKMRAMARREQTQALASEASHE